MVVWEPIPDLCTPAELANLQVAAAAVEIISPNGEELMDFFASDDVVVDRDTMVQTLLARCGDRPRQAVVVRDGADGSRLYFMNRVIHFKAFHQDAGRVVDPTGGGNTYLGALAMALSGKVVPDLKTTLKHLGQPASTVSSELMRMVVAALHGTIAASFAIEQIGTPVLDASSGSWNGEQYEERYSSYLRREQAYLSQQLTAYE